MKGSEHLIPVLDRDGLRRFGLTTGVIVAILFGVVLPWLLSFSMPVWPWVLGSVLVLWALAAPSTLGQVYRGWMRFGLMLNRITSPLILGTVFFLVFLPTALALRALGKDPMRRRIEPNTTSYRTESSRKRREQMEHPF